MLRRSSERCPSISLNKDKVEVLLRKHDQNRLVEKIVRVTEKPALAAGENYLADVVRLEAEVILTEGRKVKRNYIIKKKIPSSVPRMAMFKSKIFMKEKLMYENILKGVRDLMDEFDETEDKLTCDFYGCDRNGNLILEDLKVSGYRTGCRLKGLSLIEAMFAVRGLARFHAATFELLKRDYYQPQTFQSSSGVRNNPWTCEVFFVKPLRNLCKVIDDSWGPEWKLICEKLNKPSEELIKMVNSLKENDNFPMKTLLHGDAWTNNIMLRYDQTGYPISVKLVDFQLGAYESPAYDLTYFLYTSVEAKIRHEEPDKLIELYQKTLSDALERYGVPASEIPTIEQIKSEMKRLRLWGLVILIAYYSFISGEEESNVNLEKVFSTDGEEGHNINNFKRPGWREYTLQDFRLFIAEGII